MSQAACIHCGNTALGVDGPCGRCGKPPFTNLAAEMTKMPSTPVPLRFARCSACGSCGLFGAGSCRCGAPDPTNGPDPLILILQEVGHALLSPLDPETAKTWAEAAATWEASAETGYDVPPLVAVQALCHRLHQHKAAAYAAGGRAGLDGAATPHDLAETQARATAREAELLAKLGKAEQGVADGDATVGWVSLTLWQALGEPKGDWPLPRLLEEVGAGMVGMNAARVMIAELTAERDDLLKRLLSVQDNATQARAALLRIAQTPKGAKLLFRRCVGDMPTQALSDFLVEAAIAAESIPF